MARIFDNIDLDLLSALRATIRVSVRADCRVGALPRHYVAKWDAKCQFCEGVEDSDD